MRFGILGDANIARRNLRPAILNAGHQITAIGRRNPDEGLDPIWEGVRVTDYESLLLDDEVDVIYNALPNHLHVPYAIKALEAGKPVLCEKPVALSLAELEALSAAAERANLYLYDGYMVRYHPQWAWLRNLDIGERQMVQAHFSYPPRRMGDIRNQAEWGGGPIWDIGCYCLLSAMMLFDGVPELRYLAKEEGPHKGVAKTAHGIIAFVKEGRADDQILQFCCSSDMALGQSVEVRGRQGWARLEVPFNPPSITRGFYATGENAPYLGAGEEVIFEACDQYQLMVEDFVTACAQGRKTDLSDSYHLTRILSQMVEA